MKNRPESKTSAASRWRHACLGLLALTACGGGPAAVTDTSRAEPGAVLTSGSVTADSEGAATIQYRAARQALAQGDTVRALQRFDEVITRWPTSVRGPNAMYWKAFVLVRRGKEQDLLVARRLLQLATQLAPASHHVGDAPMLLLRVQYRLAASGDHEALEDLEVPNKDALAMCADGAGADRLAWAVDVGQPLGVRLERLGTLMNSNASCTVLLRQQALLLLGSVPNAAGLPKILEAAERDSSRAVRRQAIRSIPIPAPDAARPLLDSVLRTSEDVTSLEAAAAAWASRPDWGVEALETYLRRENRNATAADYIKVLLGRTSR